ncbi:hypothetical protein AZI85_13255 [Bdellovibrio bacteriovorus]|uniref:Uncharacterized protein n=1 Tax=Bdellovibrio bacteriovorus TaxID=959 RepID=A0A150WBU0_BDEBC|nr:hypothetical protein [Bdellovibrio bacteriovorus]KYG60429.1 hypothetical protein AZI85_13255 [Bdellovibrio bacteriovorus]
MLRFRYVFITAVFFSVQAFAQLIPTPFWTEKEKGPVSFAFADVAGVNPSTMVVSDSITLAGYGGTYNATCSGCEIERNGNGTWSTSVSGFNMGDTIRIRLTSSASLSGTATGTVTVGETVAGAWTVTTRHPYPCATAEWGSIPHGSSVTAYSASTSNACASISESRTCTDGSLSGTYTFNVCNNNCNVAPWGWVAHGAGVTAYQTVTANSCAAVAETRTCNNGTLSGSYTNANCSNNCNVSPWGWVTHGNSVTAYASATSNSCAGVAQTRTCSNGTLAGTYAYGTCNNNCNVSPWGWIAHGTSVTAYAGPTGPCVSQSRSCSNGSLSGSYTYAGCTACNAASNTTNMCAGYTYDAGGACISAAGYCASGSGTCVISYYYGTGSGSYCGDAYGPGPQPYYLLQCY